MRRVVSALALAGLLAGCNLAPHYDRPAAPVPTRWPDGASYAPNQPGTPGLPWRSLIGDPKLVRVIELTLANNRDLRAAVANVEAARAEYHVQRSYQLPTLTGAASASIQRGITSSRLNSDSYDANIGISSFEIDLFGRLKNLTREQFETYLATASGTRSTRLTIVSEATTAFATLASDRDLLAIANDTVASGQRSLELVQQLFRAGLDSAVDVQNAITVVEQARADAQNYTTEVAQDRNALELLAGQPLSDGLLPTGLAELDPTIANVPAGLSSEILLQRPDVVEAEHSLKAQYAAIGAARAAFFPTITLTSALGVASSALSQLFTGGALNVSATPSASVPILGGTTRGNLEYARAEQRYYVAAYEKAVQQAFKDVADGLARRGTIVAQREAEARLVTASARAVELADAQFRAGTGDYLDILTAQRTLYSNRQTQISVILNDLSNRITLYEAIGADSSL